MAPRSNHRWRVTSAAPPRPWWEARQPGCAAHTDYCQCHPFDTWAEAIDYATAQATADLTHRCNQLGEVPC